MVISQSSGCKHRSICLHLAMLVRSRDRMLLLANCSKYYYIGKSLQSRRSSRGNAQSILILVFGSLLELKCLVCKSFETSAFAGKKLAVFSWVYFHHPHKSRLFFCDEVVGYVPSANTLFGGANPPIFCSETAIALITICLYPAVKVCFAFEWCDRVFAHWYSVLTLCLYYST